MLQRGGGQKVYRVVDAGEYVEGHSGFVVEVLLLVVVILLYEKTGSKKQPQSGDEGNNYQPTIPSHEENAEVDGGATTRQRKV
uniref:Uncharacterized protein n=1 Tax=Knipowitschia caucasica TaxID=637954 RepID=A0AAV2MRJ0_KNICA